MTTWPPSLSTAAMTRAAPTASDNCFANARSGAPSLKKEDPAMTCVAPASSSSWARATVRTPPPTRHDSRPASCRTSARFSPVPIAASRSMTCTFGKRSNRRTHRKTSSSRIARRSPCTSCTTPSFWRSMEGISTASTPGPDRNAVRGEVTLQRAHARLRVVKDGRGEGGVSAPRREHVDEVLQPTGAARRDDRNRHSRRHGRGERAVEPGLRAVAIDRGQQDLAGAPPPRVAREAIPPALRVDGDDDRLAAVSSRERGDQPGVGERRRVEADLVGARVDGRRGVIFTVDAASYRKRNEQLGGDASDGVGARAARLDRRRDVEDDELVDPLRVVASRGPAGGAPRGPLSPVDG